MSVPVDDHKIPTRVTDLDSVSSGGTRRWRPSEAGGGARVPECRTARSCDSGASETPRGGGDKPAATGHCDAIHTVVQ